MEDAVAEVGAPNNMVERPGPLGETTENGLYVSYALRRANRSTGDIEMLLRQRHPDLLAFDADPEQSFLALSGVAEGEETIKAEDRQDRT